MRFGFIILTNYLKSKKQQCCRLDDRRSQYKKFAE